MDLTAPILTGTLGAGMNLLSTKMQSDAIKAQIAADNKLRQQLRGDLSRLYGEGRDKVTGMYAPYTDLAGKGVEQLLEQGQTTVAPMDFKYGKTTQDFLDPSMQFQIDEAARGIQSGAAASNSLLSGAAQRALAENARSQAETGYADAYARMMQDRQQTYNERRDSYQDKINELRRKYGMTTDLTNLGMGAIDKTAGAVQDFTTQQAANLSGTMPQSSAGVAGQAWGQTFGNLGGATLDLAGRMIPGK